MVYTRMHRSIDAYGMALVTSSRVRGNSTGTGTVQAAASVYSVLNYMQMQVPQSADESGRTYKCCAARDIPCPCRDTQALTIVCAV